MRGHYEAPKVSGMKFNLYKNKLISSPYLHPVRMSETLTLAASTEYSITLSAFRGVCALMAYTLRALPLTAANQATYVTDITDHNVNNNNGESMLGHYRISYEESRDIVYHEKFDNLFADNSGFAIFPFSTNPVDSYKRGNNHGFQPFTGFERLSFTTASTLTPGSHRVDVYGWFYSTSHVQQGQIRTRKPS